MMLANRPQKKKTTWKITRIYFWPKWMWIFRFLFGVFTYYRTLPRATRWSLLATTTFINLFRVRLSSSDGVVRQQFENRSFNWKAISFVVFFSANLSEWFGRVGKHCTRRRRGVYEIVCAGGIVDFKNVE